MKEDATSRREGLPAEFDASTRVLILGSFPSKQSLCVKQYYAYSRNRFWDLMSKVLDEALLDMEYDQRLQALRKHHIGLWDVIASCVREGSLDAAIRDHRNNNFNELFLQMPELRRICFNGQKAEATGESCLAIRDFAYKKRVLPSSSPAHTLAFELKLEAWRKALLD